MQAIVRGHLVRVKHVGAGKKKNVKGRRKASDKGMSTWNRRCSPLDRANSAVECLAIAARTASATVWSTPSNSLRCQTIQMKRRVPLKNKSVLSNGTRMIASTALI